MDSYFTWEIHPTWKHFLVGKHCSRKPQRFLFSLPIISVRNIQQQLLAFWYAKNLNIQFSSISNIFRSVLKLKNIIMLSSLANSFSGPLSLPSPADFFVQEFTSGQKSWWFQDLLAKNLPPKRREKMCFYKPFLLLNLYSEKPMMIWNIFLVFPKNLSKIIFRLNFLIHLYFQIPISSKY